MPVIAPQIGGNLSNSISPFPFCCSVILRIAPPHPSQHSRIAFQPSGFAVFPVPKSDTNVPERTKSPEVFIIPPGSAGLCSVDHGHYETRLYLLGGGVANLMRKLILILAMFAAAAQAQTRSNYKFSVPTQNATNYGTLNNSNWSLLDALLGTGSPSTSLNIASVYGLNGPIYVDGVKYALNATGIQQAINAAIANGTYDVELPCGDIAVNTTINITNGPMMLNGCSGGDFTNTNSAAVTRLIYTGSAGSDLLNIDSGSSTRLAGIRLQNMMLDGNGLARYSLRTVTQDTTYVVNVKPRAAVTANWYHANMTGTVAINVQVTCEQTGGSGLVLDWGSNNFTGIEVAADTGSCASSTGVLIWIGGGGNRSIHFFGLQLNENTVTPTGFLLVTGYDSTSPWAGVPSGTVAGAPSNIAISNLDTNYGASAPAPSSQGADVLINGTATNPVTNVSFYNAKINAQGASGGGQIGIKVDHASNVRIHDSTSQGHTSGTAAMLNTTANASAVSMYDPVTTDTNRLVQAATGEAIDIATTGGQFGIGASTDLVQFFNASVGVPEYVLNATGTNFGLIQNTSTTTFSLAHGSASTSNGTADLTWGVAGVTLNNQLNVANLLISPTAPTIAAGDCGGSAASIPSNNGTAAFAVNVGTAPTSGGCTITLPAATTDWVCSCTDRTTNSTSVFSCKQSNTSASTTSAVLTNYSDVAVATAFTANDVLRVSCMAY